MKLIKDYQYEEGLEECKRWLEDKYDGLTEFEEWNNFGLKDIHISKGGKSVMFYHKPNPNIKGKRIRVGLRGCDTFRTYLRKLPYLPPMGGIPIPRYLGYRHSLIHELTHFIQFLQKRKMSEVETTRNEIEYILLQQPLYHFQFIKYDERKRQEEELRKYKKEMN